jgi:hypothetical protein
MAINEWLHWYKLFRMPEPDADDVARLTAIRKALMGTLERVFPFQVRVGNSDKTRSMWCTEKVHSILYVPRTIRRMGCSQNFSCQVTETTHNGQGERQSNQPKSNHIREKHHEFATEGFSVPAHGRRPG